MVTTLPVVLLLIDDLQRRQWKGQMLKDKVPYVLLSILFGIIALFGKQDLVAATTLSAKILMAAKSTMFYLWQIFVPLKFSLLYPYIGQIMVTSPDFYLPLIGVILLIGAALVSRRYTRVLFFAVAFYVLTLAPTFLNFSKGGDMDVYFASDRYAYIPSIGVFFLVASIVMWGLSRWSGRVTSMTIRGIVALLLLGLGIKAYAQSFIWKDTESLFANVIAQFPDSSHVAHNNLGNMYRLRGQTDKAIEEYEKALAVRPHAKTFSNLGATYRAMKQYDRALETYKQAIALDLNSKEAHAGLAIVLAELGQREEAKVEYRKALIIDPKYALAYANLGSLLLQEGDTQGAIDAYKKALESNSTFTDIEYNLAIAYTKAGMIDEAIHSYRSVITMMPQSIPARINLGLLYAKQGERERATQEFETILKIDPNNKTAKEAIRQLEK
jgi:tetratricopeptide (TPR) repeat protein